MNSIIKNLAVIEKPLSVDVDYGECSSNDVSNKKRLQSISIYRLNLKDRIKDGYTPYTSPSRNEADVLREFTDSKVDPSITTVIIRARDKGSMHRLKHLNESIWLLNFLHNNISENSTNGSVNTYYKDVCTSYCDANLPIGAFYKFLNNQIERIRLGRTPSKPLIYPISNILGFEVHLERNFFGVKTKPNNFALNPVLQNQTFNENEVLSLITNIDYIEAIMLIFYGNIDNSFINFRYDLWEMAVYKFIRSFNSSLIDVHVLGDEIVDYEMNRDAQRTAPYFAMGFLLMFLFVGSSILFSSLYYRILDYGKCILVFGIALCPILAITTTFGIFSLIGFRTNSPMLIMPFLISGIGVNDAFLITHAWNRLAAHKLDNSKRMQFVFEEVGPSITITTLTNVSAFTIGALTPISEISLFCGATAVALIFAYIYTLTLYGPLIFYATRIENARQNDAVLQNKTEKSSKKSLMDYTAFFCFVLQNKFFGIFLLLFCIIYWFFALNGTIRITPRLDAEMILPKNSPILEPHKILSRLIWTEYYPLSIFINNPLDIRDSKKLMRFNSMMEEYEALEHNKGREFTICWFRDYERYYNRVLHYEDLINSASRENNDTWESFDHNDLIEQNQTGLDYDHLEQFLSLPMYKHYRSFIKFSSAKNSKQVPLDKFFCQIIYRNVTNWDDRIDILLKWRAIATKYSTDLNVTIWQFNSYIIDQMLSLKPLAYQTTLITLLATLFVCAIFIKNPVTVIVAVAAIASISIGVVGYLSFWHLHLDPITLCAVLMSIGMSVDFTAHVAYSFQTTEKRKLLNNEVIAKITLRTSNEKLSNSIRSVAWPMFQGGLSSVICIIPLIFLQNYIPLVFVKTVTLVVIWGLFHGIILLPAFLSNIPPHWLEFNCSSILFDRNIEPRKARTDNEINGQSLVQTTRPLL